MFGLFGLFTLALVVVLLYFSGSEMSDHRVRLAWWGVVTLGPLLLVFMTVMAKRHIDDRRRGRI
ncbi:hypothetical protein DSY14_03645 [Nocardiopsis sp. MG754419]|nr:hypothetical protein [Nocardiopsis sp. MG754419]